MYYYIPKGIPDDWISSLIPQGSTITVNKVKYFLNNLGYVYTRQQENLDTTGYVILNSRILQSQIREYQEIIKLLEDRGLIEVNRSYSVNKSSRGYRFTESTSTKVVSSEIHQFTHIKTLKKGRKKYVPAKFLDKWLEDERLTYDSIKAEKLVSRITAKGDTSKAIAYNQSIARIQNRDFSIGRDQTSLRYHSPMTNLKSELRQFFKFEGKKLYQVDLTNSQPYLSQLLLLPTFYTHTLSLLSIFPTSSLSTTYMLVKSFLDLNNQCFNRYIKDVNSGLFYERFIEQMQIKICNPTKYQEISDEATAKYFKAIKGNWKLCFKKRSFIKKCIRASTKTVMYQVLFSHNSWMNQGNPISKYDASLKYLFKSIYPEVYEVFCSIKESQKNQLAILLQRIESFLIIDRCCKKISTERPLVPIYTIHDSIVSTKENMDYIKSIIEEEIGKQCNHAPNLNISPL